MYAQLKTYVHMTNIGFAVALESDVDFMFPADA